MVDGKQIEMVANVFVVIGALNWGLIAISPSANLVSMIGDLFDKDSEYKMCRTFDRFVYLLVGLSALYLVLSMGGKKK